MINSEYLTCVTRERFSGSNGRCRDLSKRDDRGETARCMAYNVSKKATGKGRSESMRQPVKDEANQ
jgi:hypothetical protein